MGYHPSLAHSLTGQTRYIVLERRDRCCPVLSRMDSGHIGCDASGAFWVGSPHACNAGRERPIGLVKDLNVAVFGVTLLFVPSSRA